MELPPPIPEAYAPKTSTPSTMSLLARLINVFAIPSQVFEEVKNTQASISNWLVPALIVSVMGALSAMVMYSQPALLLQIHEQQTQYLEQRVKAGQMTKSDADQAEVLMKKFMGPTMLKIIVSAGAIVKSFLSIFGWGLVLWLLGRKFLKVNFTYLKTVEVVGLATMISALGAIVKLLLIVNLGKMFSSQSLGLAISDFDPDHPNFLLIGAINVFEFWFIGLLALGLARLANTILPRTLFLVMGFWMVIVTLLLYLGLGGLVL